MTAGSLGGCGPGFRARAGAVSPQGARGGGGRAAATHRPSAGTPFSRRCLAPSGNVTVAPDRTAGLAGQRLRVPSAHRPSCAGDEAGSPPQPGLGCEGHGQQRRDEVPREDRPLLGHPESVGLFNRGTRNKGSKAQGAQQRRGAHHPATLCASSPRGGGRAKPLVPRPGLCRPQPALTHAAVSPGTARSQDPSRAASFSRAPSSEGDGARETAAHNA